MYFRVEDENGIDPNLRNYGWNESFKEEIKAKDMDEFIANEIRNQINNSNNSKIFSCSKSLGVILFKYNYLCDNPIHLIPFEFPGSFLEFYVINENGEVNSFCMKYDISNLAYPIRNTFRGDKIILKNYVIEVDNNILVNEYLKNYTHKEKKKMAACEKDKEVIIRYIETDYIIGTQWSIDAVYLIYALQYKTKFLNWGSVTEELIKIFKEELAEDEYNSLRNLVLYLKYNWQYEEQVSKIVIQEKQKDARLVLRYDSYFLALDIMEGKLECAYNNCMLYLPYRLLSKIWKVYSLYVNLLN